MHFETFTMIISNYDNFFLCARVLDVCFGRLLDVCFRRLFRCVLKAHVHAAEDLLHFSRCVRCLNMESMTPTTDATSDSDLRIRAGSHVYTFLVDEIYANFLPQ